MLPSVQEKKKNSFSVLLLLIFTSGKKQNDIKCVDVEWLKHSRT